MSDDAADIAPCPFCKGVRQAWVRIECPHGNSHQVKCLDCAAAGPTVMIAGADSETLDEAAIEVWNWSKTPGVPSSIQRRETDDGHSLN